jgi:thioesterase domain-containing protein
MAAAMPLDHSIYGLRWVHLDGAHVPLSVEQLAAGHLRQIRNVQERGPYQLIGYSFGGLVACEMGTLLVNSGEEVAVLALVDTLHPFFHRNLSAAELTRFRKAYLADRIKKYTRNLIQGRFDNIGSSVWRYMSNKVKPIAGKAARPLPNIDRSLITSQMWHSYTPKEFKGRLVLFRVEKAIDGGAEFDDDPSLGWHKYATKGVDIQFVAGGHGTVMQMPSVVDLINKLVPYLGDTERRTNRPG